jgi:hypothetical protein
MEDYTVDVWGTACFSTIVEAESDEEAKEKAAELARIEGGEMTDVQDVRAI